MVKGAQRVFPQNYEQYVGPIWLGLVLPGCSAWRNGVALGIGDMELTDEMQPTYFLTPSEVLLLLLVA